MQSVIILVNPVAGLNQGKSMAKQVCHFLDQHLIKYWLYYSEYDGHISYIINEHFKLNESNHSERVIVIGGDGTLHQVVNCLKTHHHELPILYLPAGSGNDFARSFSQAYPSLNQQLNALLKPSTIHSLPLICIQINQGKIVYALNSIGFGLDAYINHLAQHIHPPKWLPQKIYAKARYLIAVIKSLTHIPSFSCQLITPHKKRTSQCQIVCVLNNPFLGGGIPLDTKLEAKEDILSFVMLHNVKVKDIIPLIWRILVTHQPHSHPCFTYQHLNQLSFKLEDTSIMCQIDGEMYQFDSLAYQFSISHYPFIL